MEDAGARPDDGAAAAPPTMSVIATIQPKPVVRRRVPGDWRSDAQAHATKLLYGGRVSILSGGHPLMPGYSGNKPEIQRRLRRIEGQVRGLQRMVDQDVYCIDVLTQVSAATKALQSVALELLGEHLSHCVQDALLRGGEDAEEKVREAQAAISRLVRS